MAGGLITYEENGFPVELVSDRDIERAVRQGRLRPDTLVRSYGPDGAPITGRADAVAHLKPFLGIGDAGPPLAAASPAVAPDPPSGAGPDVGDGLEGDAGRVWDGNRDERRERGDAAPAGLAAEAEEQVWDTASPAPQPSGNSELKGILALIGLIVALLAGVAIFSGGGDGGGGGGETGSNSIADAAEEKSPTDVVGVEASYWVNREVRVRQAPGGSAVAMGSLKRGDLVRALPVRGPQGAGDWVRIEAGEFAGGYAWLKNLSTAPRPPLGETVDKTRQLAGGRPLFEEPDTSAAQLRSLEPGATVRLVGITEAGWWEAALEGGGVGYLEPGIEFAGCTGAKCRIMAPDGWGGIRAGMTVEEAEAASGLTLIRPGQYEEVFADEPDRLFSCNIHGLAGAPGNLSVFVEKGVVTSLGAYRTEPGSVRFETNRGVGLGDTEEAVRRAYPDLAQEPDIYSQPPDKKLFHKRDDGTGIKFSIAGGRVVRIDAGGGSINYVEGCL
jgi:hypothetical protein